MEWSKPTDTPSGGIHEQRGGAAQPSGSVTQASLPTEDAAVVLLFSLVASGQIKLRKLDDFEKMAHAGGR